jgi:hypothetical protein
MTQRDNSAVAIASSIVRHGPPPGHVILHEAPFWSASQGAFLREAIVDGAGWAAVADELNLKLHTRH